MADRLTITTRLAAWERQRALRISTHQLVSIRPHAMVLAPLQMAGEDASLHAIALGRLGAVPEVLSVPDPRNQDAEARLFADLRGRLEVYFQSCFAANDAPQFIVSSGAAIGLLDALADRLRYSRSPELKRLGQLLAWATERVPVAGQHSLHSATDVLLRHWVTGSDPADESHLGAVMAWIEPPPGMPLYQAVEAAELKPMGIKTLPAFDQKLLEPLVRKYGEAPSAARAQQIHDALTPVCVDIYRQTQRAIAILLAKKLPRLAGLDRQDADEKYLFERFMDWTSQGNSVPVTDKAPAAVRKLIERESQQEMASPELLEDRVERARAQLAGTSSSASWTSRERPNTAARRCCSSTSSPSRRRCTCAPATRSVTSTRRWASRCSA
jgi:hypothetical protein